MIFDAIVVGAGPAGSHAAYLLAKGGRSVALLDKARYPRDKVCGGGLSRKTLDLADFDLAPVIHNRVRKATLTFRDQMRAEVIMSDVAACTSVRAEFDAFLADRAREAGARFMDGTAFVDADERNGTVTVQTTAGTLTGRRLLGADGIGSTVRKRVFGVHAVRQVPAVEALLRVPQDVLDAFHDRALFDLGGMHRGYGWIFPKRDHLNVGVYSPWGGRALRGQLQAFMAHHDVLARHDVLAQTGYAIPLFDHRRAITRGRCWLIGDAAGFAEGLYGEGIYFAMRSGQLAAQALLESDDASAGTRFEALVRTHLAPELRCSNFLGRAYFAFPGFAFRHLAMNPRGQQKFAGVITGEVSYRECLAGTVRSLPRWLFFKARPPRD